jgi:RimJ/RimL family protein N-acetyltransferase
MEVLVSSASQEAAADEGPRQGDLQYGRGWLRSLALHSDLVILGDLADVQITEMWISVRTSTMPQLRLGNAVLLPRPPEVEDVPRWIERLEHEVGKTSARYGRIAWEGGRPPEDVYRAFRDAGFEPYDSLGMRTSVLHSRVGASAAGVRLVSSNEEWTELLDFQTQISHISTSEDRDFLATRLNHYQSSTESGRGAWFASYSDGRVAGTCGVALGHGIARLQGLETSTQHRRTGVALSLVEAACEWAMQQRDVHQLVAVVDPDYHARRLFQSVGFQPHDLACAVVPVGTLL